MKNSATVAIRPVATPVMRKYIVQKTVSIMYAVACATRRLDAPLTH